MLQQVPAIAIRTEREETAQADSIRALIAVVILGIAARIDSWSLTSLQQRLVKTGGRLVKHARYYWLLLAESHLTRRLRVDAPANLGPARHDRLTVACEERRPEASHQSGEVSRHAVEPRRFRSIPGRDGSRFLGSGRVMVGDQETGCNRLAPGV